MIFAVLQIILFFKVWGMTNDVAALRKQFVAPRHIFSVGDKATLKPTGEDVEIVGSNGIDNIVVKTANGQNKSVKYSDLTPKGE